MGRNRVSIGKWVWKVVITPGVTVDFDMDLRSVVTRRDCRRKFIGLFGWRYRHQDLLNQHIDELGQIFALDANLVAQTKSFLNERISSGVLIGIHLRGTDYKEFEGGNTTFSPRGRSS